VGEELSFCGMILQEFLLIGQRKKSPNGIWIHLVAEDKHSTSMGDGYGRGVSMGVPFLAEFPLEGKVQGLPLGMT
jgi:hypothetical protein